MKGLIIKDLINMKKYSRTLLLITAVYIIFFAYMTDSMEFLSGMIVLMFTMSSVTSFSYDSQSGWDMYALTLPLSRRHIVLSKYVLSMLLALAGMMLSILAGWLFGLFKHESNFTETLLTSYSLFAIAVIFLCVLLPLVYRFGAERSRVIIIAVFAIPAASLIVLSQTGVTVTPDEALFHRLLLVSPLVLVACTAVSIALSCRIFRHKAL